MNKEQAIQRAVDVMRRQHKSLATEDNYKQWIKRYITAIFQMPSVLTSEQKMERFLTELAARDVSAATQNQAFNAILFFYRDCLGVKLKDIDALRAQRPEHMRRALPVEEVRTLLAAVSDTGGYPANLVTHLLYGCGLRVGEAVALRIKDIDIGQQQITIREPKCGHDRVVKMPCALVGRIEQQMEAARQTWLRDVRDQIPIQLPHQLARKYPEFECLWQWAWFTPLKYPSPDPHDPRRMVRWHLLTATIQRAVKRARRETGIMAVPHELRHSYATHCLNRGTNIKALAKAMGHAQITTTERYCHADALSVKSPLDA
jgi:site-specific recombinase XerD